MGATKKRSVADKTLEKARDKLRSIPDRSPREFNEQLEELGYTGQVAARRKLCLMAYRHLRRLKDHYLKGIPFDNLAPKYNILMAGPTGCGKTRIVELLFGNILSIPVLSLDITEFSETGYAGRSVHEIPHDLLSVAGTNSYWAMMGVVVLDEFDKIAGCSSDSRFGGAGSSKDVSGYGLQRELLKLIEGDSYCAPSDGLSLQANIHAISTRNVAFIACGAFSGLDKTTPSDRRENIGFGFTSSRQQKRNVVDDVHTDSVTSVDTFTQYGFIPELIGRFNSLVSMSPLGPDELRRILVRNLLPAHRKEFGREGLVLNVPAKVLDEIVEKALTRKTGARALNLQLNEYIEQRAFEGFGRKRKHKVRP